MSAPILTPLTVTDGLRLAATVCGKGEHDLEMCAECVAVGDLLRAVDVAARTQAREDIQSGVSPLPPFPPLAERACMRCSSKPARMEVAAPDLDCRAFFCSVACIRSFEWTALLQRWARPDDDEPSQTVAALQQMVDEAGR